MWGRDSSLRRRRGSLGAFIGDGSEIDGKYTCTGIVHLEAHVTGEIHARDTLIVGAASVVRASVQAATLVVHGQIVGNVVATERVEIKAGARVTGDVEAPVIVMEAGAVHDGHCRMTKPEAQDAAPAIRIAINA